MKNMVVAAQAGTVYALIVFGVGFVLGTVRVLLIVPRLGETTAVILETPLMLAASWYVCRWCVERLDVPRTITSRSIMGVVAFGVLMLAELALALLAFGRPFAEQFGVYVTGAGAIGFAGQVIFALFPITQIWRR